MDAELFERIVQEVLRRLRQWHQPVVGEDAAAGAADPDLILMDQVVTMNSIAGKLDGVRQVVVRRRAVVTPLVVDELRDRGVTLVREH